MTLFLVVFVAGDTFTADPEPAATRIQTYPFKYTLHFKQPLPVALHSLSVQHPIVPNSLNFFPKTTNHTLEI